MKLAKKHAQRIAILFNSVEVRSRFAREVTQTEPYDKESHDMWVRGAVVAAIELRDKYGINAIGMETYIANYEKGYYRG